MWKEAKLARKKEVYHSKEAYHILTKIQNNKQNMVIFYKKLKKYNEIQLTKKQNGLK